MSIEHFVKNYSEEDLLTIMFDWNGKHAENLIDRNLKYRSDVLKLFKENSEIFSVELVADLFDAETQLAKEAWGVNRVVSDLATVLLEKGRTRYVDVYLKGLSRGMDAYIQSSIVRLSDDCIEELLSFANRRPLERAFKSEDQAKFFASFLVSLKENH